MKKLIAPAIVLLLCAALATGCGQKGNGDMAIPGATLTQIPAQEAESAADFTPLGVTIDAPQNAEGVSYSIIGDTVAQVEFSQEGHEYVYRAAQGEVDLSGVYRLLDDEVVNVNWEFEDACVTATINKTESGGMLATWYEAGVTHSLWAEEAVGDDAMAALVLKLVVQQGLADAVQEPEPFSTIDFLKEGTCQADLDGDGTLETITLVTTVDEYEWTHNTIRVTTADGSEYELRADEEEWLLEIQWLDALQVVDLDPDDSFLEIVFTGDYCSSDYATLVCRFDGTQLLLSRYRVRTWDESETYGGLRGLYLGIEPGGDILIGDHVDVLGTWWGTQHYVLFEDGTLTFVPLEGMWRRNMEAFEEDDLWGEDGIALTTIAPLPVQMQDGPKERLPVGTQLVITGTDEVSKAWFLLKDGSQGFIEFTRNVGEWETYIDGIPESEYFETLPYAG